MLKIRTLLDVDERIARGIQGTKPGSIILLHVMFLDGKSMQATRPIIQQLKAQGYRFLTVSEMLDHKAKTNVNRP